MRTVQDLLFDVTGQLVYFDAPEGRPSAVTSVTVYPWNGSDEGTAETALGSGSVETGPSTTIDAASGSGQADPRVLNVTATTGTVTERSYLLTSADGLREWFDVLEFDSGNTITAKHPLHNAYATGDTVQSTRIQATIDATWVADETNLDDSAGPNPSYRVRWVYVVGGVTYVADSYFNLVRYAGKHGVRPQDVELSFPGWLNSLPTDHYQDQGRRLIDEAYRAVKIDLHAVWTDDAMVANPEIIDELTRWKCLEAGELAKLLSGGGGSEIYGAARTAYSTRFDALARITNKLPIRDVTASATIKESLGLTRR